MSSVDFRTCGPDLHPRNPYYPHTAGSPVTLFDEWVRTTTQNTACQSACEPWIKGDDPATRYETALTPAELLACTNCVAGKPETTLPERSAWGCTFCTRVLAPWSVWKAQTDGNRSLPTPTEINDFLSNDRSYGQAMAAFRGDAPGGLTPCDRARITAEVCGQQESDATPQILPLPKTESSSSGGTPVWVWIVGVVLVIVGIFVYVKRQTIRYFGIWIFRWLTIIRIKLTEKNHPGQILQVHDDSFGVPRIYYVAEDKSRIERERFLDIAKREDDKDALPAGWTLYIDTSDGSTYYEDANGGQHDRLPEAGVVVDSNTSEEANTDSQSAQAEKARAEKARQSQLYDTLLAQAESLSDDVIPVGAKVEVNPDEDGEFHIYFTFTDKDPILYNHSRQT